MEKATENVQGREGPPTTASEGQEAERVAGPTYPLVPLKNTVIFPGALITLNIGREKSILAIKAANDGDHRFIAAAQREADTDQPGPDDIFDIGTLVEIKQSEVQSDGTVQVVVRGIARVRILNWLAQDPYLHVEYEEQQESTGEDAQLQVEAQSTALVRHAHSLFERFTHLSRRVSADENTAVAQINNPARLADTLAGHVVTDHAQQQELLEVFNPLDRLEKVCVTLGNEIEILELENKIRQKVRQQVDKNQREYYLKEQLRAIQEELGHDQASEMAELREKVAAKGLSAEVATKGAKDLDRLERMPAHSAELVVLRNYIDWILALPWEDRTEDRLDMKYAKKVLDEDHYGLEKVKERIAEFLAVRQLRIMQAQRRAAETAGGEGDEPAPLAPSAHKGPILCLVGPP